MVGMCRGKVKNGGGGPPERLERENGGRWSGITDFVGIRGVSGTRYCDNCVCSGHGWTSGWHSAGMVAGGDERLERKDILKTMVSRTAKM